MMSNGWRPKFSGNKTKNRKRNTVESLQGLCTVIIWLWFLVLILLEQPPQHLLSSQLKRNLEFLTMLKRIETTTENTILCNICLTPLFYFMSAKLIELFHLILLFYPPFDHTTFFIGMLFPLQNETLRNFVVKKSLKKIK